MPEILRGTFGATSLMAIVQLVESDAVTGWLRLEPSGLIGFIGGRPVSAEYLGHQGIDALLDLFIDSQKTFRLETPGPPGPAAPLGSLVGLVIEGCRLSDEWQRISGLVYAARADAAEGIDERARKVVELLDGRSPLVVAVQRAAVPKSGVIDALLDLAARGALHQPTTPPAPMRSENRQATDAYHALDRGREALRAGRFDEAEQWFESALALRPDDRVVQQNLNRVRQLRKGDGNNGLLGWFRSGRGK